MIWDRIITSPARAKINLKNQTPKYKIHDITHKISARGNVTLTFHWNVQPHVGALTWGVSGESQAFVLPPIVDKKKPVVKKSG